MANISNSAISSNALIGKAFSEADKATKAGNNSVQSMAAGIMMYHAEHHTSERATFDKMAERSEAFKLLKAEIVKEFITPRVTDKSVNSAGQPLTVDQVTKINRTNATQMVALNKGFDLAIALHASDVTSHSFDASTGLFSVPVNALLPTVDGVQAEPVGILARKDKADVRVPLDGTAYRYEIGNKLVSFTAFPAHVLSVAGYKKAKTAKLSDTPKTGASDTSTTGGASAANINADQSTWSMEQCSKMIVRLATQIEAVMREEPAMSYADWPVELCNAINELNILRDEAIAVRDSKAAA